MNVLFRMHFNLIYLLSTLLLLVMLNYNVYERLDIVHHISSGVKVICSGIILLVQVSDVASVTAKNQPCVLPT